MMRNHCLSRSFIFAIFFTICCYCILIGTRIVTHKHVLHVHAFSPTPSKSSQHNYLGATDTVSNKTRRNTLLTFVSFASVFLLPPNQILNSNKKLSTSVSIANALPLPSVPFVNTKERRQLELCLVSILRVKYWAENIALSITANLENKPATGMTDTMKAPYLEARLGAKAILTGKVGGGANSKVYLLSSFKIKECINDALYYYNESYNIRIKDKSMTTSTTSSIEQKARLKREKNDLLTASTEIIESLAAVVEFDGLDNIQDPSPRSSLALSMYNDSKATFIKRLLLERTVVYCDLFVNSFGNEKKIFCEGYIRNTYPNEIPSSFQMSYSKDKKEGESV